MKFALPILRVATFIWIYGAGIAVCQTIPVPQTFQQLAAQEDTDGDHKITIHDRTTPFVIHDENGAPVRTLTNVYQLSILLQELKRADDGHAGEITLSQIRLDENIVDRTQRLIISHLTHFSNMTAPSVNPATTRRTASTTARRISSP